MSFSTSWRALTTRAFSEKGSEFLSYDMLYQLSYMSAVAAAGISRTRIIEFACDLPCYTSKYFKQIQVLANQMRLDYALACRKVGETAREEPVRGFLLRWSASMAAGEAETDFLQVEARLAAQAFENVYSRDVETLRMWTEAYAAIIISAALMVMVSAVSMLIYPVATGMTIGVVGLTVGAAIVGAWMVWKVAPKEIRFHSYTPYCIPHRRARRLEFILLPTAAVSFMGVLVIGGGLGWAIVLASILMLPVGIAGTMLDRQVRKKDSDVSTFIRSTGSIASAVGITTSMALKKLDLRSVASLADDVKSLQGRLLTRLKPELCWHRFSLETGSETVYRTIKMFQDATRLGGEPEEVGDRSCLLATSLNFLRAKRAQVSNSFALLVLGMHFAIVGLLVFVAQVIVAFANAAAGSYYEAVEGVESAALEVFSLNFGSIGILEYTTTPVLLVLSITVAFAAKVAQGGSKYTFYNYLGVALLATGGGMVMVPPIADALFSPITAF